MIVTVTLNPSLDRTVTLDEPLTRGRYTALTPSPPSQEVRGSTYLAH